MLFFCVRDQKMSSAGPGAGAGKSSAKKPKSSKNKDKSKSSGDDKSPAAQKESKPFPWQRLFVAGLGGAALGGVTVFAVYVAAQIPAGAREPSNALLRATFGATSLAAGGAFWYRASTEADAAAARMQWHAPSDACEQPIRFTVLSSPHAWSLVRRCSVWCFLPVIVTVS